MSGNSSLKYFLANETVLVVGFDEIAVRLVQKIVDCCHVWKVILLLQVGVDEHLVKDVDGANVDIVRCEISRPGFGLTQDQITLLQHNVSVIFNTGFTNYLANWSVATAANLEATHHLVEFCNGVTSLRCVIHVSSVFTSTCREPYTCGQQEDDVTADSLMTLSHWMTPDQMDEFGRVFKTNPFVYTKMLSADLILNVLKPVPLVIVRPSIVSCCCHGLIETFKDLTLVPEGVTEKTEIGYFTNVVSLQHLLNVLVLASWYQIVHRGGARILSAVGSDVPVFYFSEKYDLVTRLLDGNIDFRKMFRKKQLTTNHKEKMQFIYKPLLQKGNFKFDTTWWDDAKVLLSDADLMILDRPTKLESVPQTTRTYSALIKRLSPVWRFVFIGLLWKLFGDTPMRQLLIANIPLLMMACKIFKNIH